MVKNLPVMWTEFDPWIRKIPWRRGWRPSLVFLPGEYHGQRRLAAQSMELKESDTTEWLTLSLFQTQIRTTVRDHFTLTEMTDINTCWQGCGEIGTLMLCCGNAKLAALDDSLVITQKIKYLATIWLSNSTRRYISIRNENIRCHKASVFIAALFIIPKKWKHLEVIFLLTVKERDACLRIKTKYYHTWLILSIGRTMKELFPLIDIGYLWE